MCPYSLHSSCITAGDKSQIPIAFLIGNANGIPHKFITGAVVTMSHDFSNIMQTLLEEARAGHFATNGEVIQRRNMLLGHDPYVRKPPAAPADAEVGLHVN